MAISNCRMREFNKENDEQLSQNQHYSLKKVSTERSIKQNMNRKNEHGETPLHRACMNAEDIEQIKKLISEGAEVNTSDNEGWTPLHAATENGNLELVKLRSL